MSEQESQGQEPQGQNLGEHGELSFEDSLRAAVATAADEAGSEVQEVQEPEGSPEGDSPAEPQGLEESAAAEPQRQDDRSLARLMEREQRLVADQTKFDESQDELNDLRARLDRFEGAQATFTDDPISYIRSVAPGIDLKRLAEGLWNEQLGDKAPAQYLEQKAATRHNTAQAERIAKLEQAEVERMQRGQQEDAQRGVQQYLGSLGTFAESASETTHPLLSLLQSKNPQMVAQSMENIARGHASQTNGQVLSPEQVAGQLEKQLGYYQLGAKEPQKAAAPEPEKGASLRNSSTQIQPDRESADELSDDYLHEQAMEAARKAGG